MHNEKASKHSSHGKVDMNRISVTNVFVNTIITALQAPEWELLLNRIGPTAMIHMLTSTSIFVPLPNDCYCQVTGYPLIHLRVPSNQTDKAPKPEASGITYPSRATSPSIAHKRKAAEQPESENSSASKRRRLTLSRSVSSNSSFWEFSVAKSDNLGIVTQR
jgi:hypothetical protein